MRKYERGNLGATGKDYGRFFNRKIFLFSKFLLGSLTLGAFMKKLSHGDDYFFPLWLEIKHSYLSK